MLGEIARAGLFVLAGGVAAVVLASIVRMLFGSANYKKQFAELEKRRDDAMMELLSRRDATEYEKARGEVSINRDFARQLDALDQTVVKTSKALQWFSAIGGIIGIIVTLLKARQIFEEAPKKIGWIEWFVSPASAADGVKSELAPLMPYIAVAILGLMGLSFLVSLGTLLLLKDTKENQARIKTADNIVKTFGRVLYRPRHDAAAIGANPWIRPNILNVPRSITPWQ